MIPIHIKHLNTMIPVVCNEHFTITRHAYSKGHFELSILGSFAAPFAKELSVAIKHRHAMAPPLCHVNSIITDTHTVEPVETSIGNALGSKLTNVMPTTGFEHLNTMIVPVTDKQLPIIPCNASWIHEIPVP